MEWYNYLSAFFAGMFLSNFIPHFVNGVSGNKFPTPFAKPRGKGLSSPMVNVLWSFFNLLVGFILFKKAQIAITSNLSLLIFFIGMACMSIMLSIRFENKDKE